MNFIATLREKFTLLGAEEKRKLVLVGVAVVLLVLAYLIIQVFTEPPSSRPRRGDRKVQYDLLTGKEPESLGINAIAAQLDSISKRIQRVEEGVAPQKPARPGAAGEDATDEEAALDIGWDSLAEDPKLSEADRALLKEIKERRASGAPERPAKPQRVIDDAPSVVAPPATEPIQVVAPPRVPATPAPTASGNKIRSFSEQKKSEGGSSEVEPGASGKGDKKKGGPAKNIHDENTITLPAGSIIGGTLITGMDASSSTTAKREPFPALLRIKQEAILPNRYTMDIRECFMIASGYGDLSSERAYMRAEAISCVKTDGTIIESTVDAYAVGEDGKTGIRGRLVSKEGAIIARGLLSGFMSGLSGLMKPAKIPILSLNPNDGYQVTRPDPSSVAEEAALSGISTASSEIAKYYLDMAKNIFPVIEVDAGRKVDFVVTRGARISGNSNVMNDLQSTVNQMQKHLPQQQNGFFRGAAKMFMNNPNEYP